MSKKDSEQYKKYQKYIKSKEFKENVRAKVLERDHYRCVACSRTEDEAPLSCHHSRYDNLFHNDQTEIDDRVTLCKYCHMGIHRVVSNFKRFTMKDDYEQSGNTNE